MGRSSASDYTVIDPQRRTNLTWAGPIPSTEGMHRVVTRCCNRAAGAIEVRRYGYLLCWIDGRWRPISDLDTSTPSPGG